MGPDQQRLTPAERANLVAYLDGELNEFESQVISTKLTKSATARREVEMLERTWEILDLLPRPKASEDFTARTLSEAEHLALAGDRFDSAVKRVAQRTAHIAVWVFASVLAAGLGFAVMQWIWPNPTARLARDLPIAEHLDEYREVGTFEFLEQLAHSPEFGTDRD